MLFFLPVLISAAVVLSREVNSDFLMGCGSEAFAGIWIRILVSP